LAPALVKTASIKEADIAAYAQYPTPTRLSENRCIIVCGKVQREANDMLAGPPFNIDRFPWDTPLVHMLRSQYKDACRSDGVLSDWDITCTDKLPLNNSRLQNQITYHGSNAIILLEESNETLQMRAFMLFDTDEAKRSVHIGYVCSSIRGGGKALQDWLVSQLATVTNAVWIQKQAASSSQRAALAAELKRQGRTLDGPYFTLLELESLDTVTAATTSECAQNKAAGKTLTEAYKQKWGFKQVQNACEPGSARTEPEEDEPGSAKLVKLTKCLGI